MRTAALLVLLCAGAPAAAADILPSAERIELANGTLLVLVEKHEVPLVSFEALLPGGAVVDPEGRFGTASLLAGLLRKGAGDRDAAAFAEAIEFVGGRLVVDAGLESIAISGEFLAHDTGLMIELLADLLRRPALEAAELDKLKARAIGFIRAAKDGDPAQLLPVYAQAFVYGEHPYGNPVTGDEASLGRITHDDVLDFYRQHFGGDRLILAVAGDFETAAMRALIESALGDWAPAGSTLKPLPAPAPAAGGRVLLVDKPGATQTYFWLGNVGVARGYPEREALDVANTLFGGRFTSMLNSRLRVDSGLTYGASSELVLPTKPGTVAIRSFTRTDATVEAIDMALETLSALHDGALAPEALESARNYILGRYPTRFETAAQLAGQFAMLEFYGLGREHVERYGDGIGAVTPESVAPVVAAVYPARTELVFVLLGDADAIREDVARYGAVTEIPITAPYFDAASY
jgi:predicted Zn-dependent peptidase